MKGIYKILIAAVVIIGVAVCIKSCVDKKDVDLKIAYIGHDFVNMSEFEQNKAQIEAAVGDSNEDGEALCDIVEISFNENLTDADRINSQRKMAAYVGGGEARLYLMEKEFADQNKDSGALKDLAEVVDLSILSGDAIVNSSHQVVAVSVKANEKLSSLGINTENLYLAIRDVSEVDSVMVKNIHEADESAQRAARYILGQ